MQFHCQKKLDCPDPGCGLDLSQSSLTPKKKKICNAVNKRLLQSSFTKTSAMKRLSTTKNVIQTFLKLYIIIYFCIAAIF